MKKVLIVEDDTFLKNMEVMKFAQNGFEVSHAGNRKEYNENIKNHPDIILLDLMLPDIDGYEILEELKKDDLTKDIPVIVFSNLGATNDIEKAKNLGATDYLIKAQYTLDEIVERLKEL